MIQQKLTELEVATSERGFYEITDRIRPIIQATGWRTGLATLLIKHTSASLLIQENADPEVRADLERFISRLVPDGSSMFEHTSEGPDDMPAHVRAALTAATLSIPIVNGRLALGTWQGIYIWEHRHYPHRRQVILHLIGE